MNNLIDFCIKGHIRNRIPQVILQRAFKPDPLFGRHNVQNLDWLIEQDVLMNKVIPDLNTIGGEQVTIELTELNPVPVEGAYIYEIPLSKTQGRNISRVMSVDYSMGRRGVTDSRDPLMGAARKMLMASTPYESTGNAQVRLVGPNTIAVHETLSGVAHLRCVLGYDDELSTVDQAYWLDYANLAVVATEMIIYNRISIELGSGSSTGGSPNDRLVQRVEEMSDAWERYQELLDSTMGKLSVLSSYDANMEHIQLPLGPLP